MSQSPAVTPITCANCSIGTSFPNIQGCSLIDRKRAANEVVCVEGEAAEYIWFVKEGTVALHRAGLENHGEGRIRAVRFQGSIIGLEGLISDKYIYSARALSPVTLCGAPRDAWDRFVGAKGTVARTALEITLRTECSDMTRSGAEGDALSRVAAWLRDEGPAGMTLTLPRRIVAELLKMRPETLSRALATLAQKGAIDVNRQHVRITNDNILNDIALGAG
jgi:CRP-like cAMP-binding protein